MVEIFTLESRSPPVPTMSRAGAGTFTVRACSTIASARPLSSATVSPLVRSAMRKPAITASETSPFMMVSIAQ